MCGLAGFVGSGDARVLRAMLDALAHRGPDGEGTYTDPMLPVRLGHRRLAILDIAGGHQPMWNEDGTIGVIYNGEIYNHMDLRRELTACGHTFATDHSDTEVLVHGYEQWGRDLPVRTGCLPLPFLTGGSGDFSWRVTDLGRSRFITCGSPAPSLLRASCQRWLIIPASQSAFGIALYRNFLLMASSQPRIPCGKTRTSCQAGLISHMSSILVK